MNAQIEMSSKLKDGNLKVEFRNKSDEAIKVPDLCVRYVIDKTQLFDNYYNIINDTLVLSLKEELDPDLYTITSREQNDGETDVKLKYTDKVLMPGKRYRSTARSKGASNIRFLILHYEELKLESVVNQ